MARKESKGFVQLEWVCPGCNTRNPGSVKVCGNCGAPQPENVKFQRTADEKMILDEKQLQAAKAGADIHCGFCGTRNPATAAACSQCGGDLKEGKARQAGQVMAAAPQMPKGINCPGCNAENPGTSRVCSQCGLPLTPPVTPSPAPAVQTTTQSKKINWLFYGGIAAFLLIFCAALVMMFALPSKSVEGTVANVTWKTSVPVEEMQAVQHSNESGNPPSDAYNVSCYDESEEVCEEKTIDQGNGYAEVVQECHTETTQFCSYRVDEWTAVQMYERSGDDLYPVYENPSLLDGQRLGTASQTMTVTFSTSEGQETFSPGSVNEYQQFVIGSVWTLHLNAFGGVVRVDQ